MLHDQILEQWLDSWILDRAATKKTSKNRWKLIRQSKTLSQLERNFFTLNQQGDVVREREKQHYCNVLVQEDVSLADKMVARAELSTIQREMKRFGQGYSVPIEVTQVLEQLDEVEAKIEAGQWEPVNTANTVGEVRHGELIAKGNKIVEDVVPLLTPYLAEINTYKQKVDEAQDEKNQWNEKNNQEIERVDNEIRDIYLEAKRYSQFGRAGNNNEENQAYSDKYDQLMDKAKALRRGIRDSEPYKKYIEADHNLTIARQQLVEQQKAAGKVIRDKLLDESPITQEEADQWAERITINSSTSARLRKLGYPKKQVINDMAEFYRMVRGRLPAMELKTEGDKRANANWSQGIVRLGSHFDKEVLFHEMAHLLEADPAIRYAAQYWRNSKAEGEAKSLRSLTGNRFYNSSEKAFPDEYVDPYAGKIYPHGSTEVFSMGVQYLAQPELTYQLLDNHQDMFELMAGMCGGLTEIEQRVVERKKDYSERLALFSDALDRAAKQATCETITEKSPWGRPVSYYLYSIHGVESEYYYFKEKFRGHRAKLSMVYKRETGEKVGANYFSAEKAARNICLLQLRKQIKADTSEPLPSSIVIQDIVPDWFVDSIFD